MSDVKTFNRLGITVKEVTPSGDDFMVALTPVQFSKLDELLGNGGAAFIGINGTYITARVDGELLGAAVERNAKAPRTNRTTPLDDRITSKMVYDVTLDAEDANILTHAEYNAGHDYGFAHINGTDFPILTVPAIEVYENAADTDPERPVYVIEYLAKGEIKRLSSYGITNLLRRVMTCKDQMKPIE